MFGLVPVTEKFGDLFDAPQPALAHGCNCTGGMGAGIAVEFRRRWPDMYDEYRARCLAGVFIPGDVFTWDAADRTVFNLGTQLTPQTPATLEAIGVSVGKMIDAAIWRGMHEIAIPRIGAGLGGLDWPDVKHAIEAITPDDVEIVVFRLG